MERLLITTALVLAAASALLALVVGRREPVQEAETGPPAARLATDTAADSAVVAHEGFLYGRITADAGDVYEGRLRFGTDEEAFWDDWFNGYKAGNPWAEHVPPEHLMERSSFGLFGIEIFHRDVEIELGRPFMVRFGVISRIDVDGRDLRVTLRNGTVFDLDRFNADDIADGVRVWDATRGVVDFVERRIRSVEFLPTPDLGSGLGGLPVRLHGTVHATTEAGRKSFTGFVQWHRQSRVGTDELVGRTGDAEVRLRFDTLRSIERTSHDSSLATLRDGSQIELTGTPAVARGHRGVHVEVPNLGRVLVPWVALQRLDLTASGQGPGGTGRSYDDFPAGGPLSGTVTTRLGQRLAGRLVFDLDESLTLETLDAAARGVNYSIPFGLIAALDATEPEVVLTVDHGEQLRLERTGDLGADNAGLLVFADGEEPPAYVPWDDVGRIEFDRPQAVEPPTGG